MIESWWLGHCAQNCYTPAAKVTAECRSTVCPLSTQIVRLLCVKNMMMGYIWRVYILVSRGAPVICFSGVEKKYVLRGCNFSSAENLWQVCQSKKCGSPFPRYYIHKSCYVVILASIPFFCRRKGTHKRMILNVLLPVIQKGRKCEKLYMIA